VNNDGCIVEAGRVVLKYRDLGPIQSEKDLTSLISLIQSHNFAIAIKKFGQRLIRLKSRRDLMPAISLRPSR
jgi:hypothetical protein